MISCEDSWFLRPQTLGAAQYPESSNGAPSSSDSVSRLCFKCSFPGPVLPPLTEMHPPMPGWTQEAHSTLGTPQPYSGPTPTSLSPTLEVADRKELGPPTPAALWQPPAQRFQGVCPKWRTSCRGLRPNLTHGYLLTAYTLKERGTLISS